MTRLNMWTVCLALVLLATLMTGMSMAQNPTSQDPKAQDGKVFEGILMDIDQNAKVLTLKEGDREMRFSFTDQTELVVPQKDGKPTVVTQGTKMRVHYMEQEKTNVATKIEIIETSAAAR
jgi:hypothetical protein